MIVYFFLRKELSSSILRLAIKFTAFDMNIESMKWNIILHIDALSRLNFNNEQIKRSYGLKDKIFNWIENNVVPLNRLACETLQDSVVMKIAYRIKRSQQSDCSGAEESYKEIKHTLTIEEGSISNGDVLVPLERFLKGVIKPYTTMFNVKPQQHRNNSN